MSQAPTAPADPAVAAEQVSLPQFVQGLLTVFGLRNFVGERSDNGIYLRIAQDEPGNHRYDIAIERQRRNSHYPVIMLTFYPNDDRYTLTDPTHRLPRRTRNRLPAFLDGDSPAIITRDQALIAAYVILEYASRRGRH
jgi:hypothetical protein